MSILDQLKTGIETRSADETAQIAKDLAAILPDESILTLEGDLGAGKTTFVKGLASAMGIQDLVTSPTYNIFNSYRGEKTLLHVDAYRLDGNPQIVDELMLEDFMVPPYCLAIEWPSNIGVIPWPVTLELDLSIRRSGNHWIRSTK